MSEFFIALNILALGTAGGVWLSIFLFVLFCALVWASEVDSFFLGTAVIVLGILIAEFVFSVAIWTFISSNILLTIAFFLGYIAIGALYAGMWRLPDFVKKNGNTIQRQYQAWKDDRIKYPRGLPREFDKDKSEPIVDVSFDTFLLSDNYHFKVSRNKDRVASWVILWPFGMAWELSHKPFIWLWETVYYALGEVYERINRDTARKILEEKNK